MAHSIFDSDPTDLPPREPEKPSRSKHREKMTGSDLVKGRRRLYDMVEKAFDTLEEAAEHADHATAVKAACAILDRAGFGPKSTVDVNQTTVDLTKLSRAELAERLEAVREKLLSQRAKDVPMLDAAVVKVETIQ